MNKLNNYLPIFVFCLLSINSFCQTKSTISKGLDIYPFDIDSYDPSELSYLDSIIHPYTIFGAAEYHWSKSTLQIEKKFITYLADRDRLDKIVIERPFAYGYWINEYLSTGDTVLLKTITDKYWWADYTYYNVTGIRYLNYYDFYKWLFAFREQKQLSFKVVGIDLDQVHNAALELWSIKEFITVYDLATLFPLSYPLLVQLFDNDEPKISKLKKWYKTFGEEMTAQKDLVSTSMGASQTDFNKFIDGVENALNYKKEGWKYRESVIAENFKMEIDPTDFVYTQYGHAHLLRSEGERFKGRGFMTEIENSPLYSGKILSIYLKCNGCKVAGNTISYWGVFTDEEYDTLLGLIGDRSVIIDFSKATEEFSDIQKYFQMSMFINRK